MPLVLGCCSGTVAIVKPVWPCHAISLLSRLCAGVHDGNIARGGKQKDVYLKDGIRTYRSIGGGAPPDIILFGSGYWWVALCIRSGIGAGFRVRNKAERQPSSL